MTINTTNITSGPYSGNGVTTTFSYTFRVETKDQLSVYESDADGVQTLLTVDSHYSVASLGVDGGGLITRLGGALPVGYTWYIRSNYQETQLVDFDSQSGFFPDVHESALDKLTFLIQQVKDTVLRSIRLSDSDIAGTSAVLPSLVSDRFLRVNSDADGFDLFTGGGDPSSVEVPLASYDDFRNNVGFTVSDFSDGQIIWMTDDVYHGAFKLKTNAITPPDNKTTVIRSTVDTDRYIERMFSGSVFSSWHEDVSGGGVVDDLTPLQELLDNFKHVYIPSDMTHGISGMLSMNIATRTLIIAGDLSRIGASTVPLLQINASRCFISRQGSSRIFANNATPDGILLFGPLDPSTAADTNVLWSHADLNLVGNLDVTSRGVTFYTTEGHGGGGSTYFNTFSGLVENVEDGAYLTSNTNGNKIIDVDFYRIGDNCIYGNGDDGSTGNLSDCYASNITAHFSSNLNAILKLQNANRNTFSNIGGEPGVGAKLHDFDANSTNNVIIGYDNTGVASVDDGRNNVRVYNGFTRYSSAQGGGSFTYIEEPSYTPALTATGGGTITLNTASDLLSVTRLGREIKIRGSITVASVSTPSGDLRISIPHSTAADVEGEGNFTGTLIVGNAAGNANAYGIIGSAGVSYMTIRRVDGTGLSTQCAADFSGNEVLYVNVSYRSASSN